MSKSKLYNELIHTERWLRLRKEVLTEHPECQDCLDRGRHTFAVEVHHVTPCDYGCDRKAMEQLMFSRGNLRALCHQCHVDAHRRLGRSGPAATRRINENKVKGVIEKFF